jgi:hypothetical protein
VEGGGYVREKAKATNQSHNGYGCYKAGFAIIPGGAMNASL